MWTGRTAEQTTHMTSTNAPKEFVRSGSQKMIAGVCGGIAEYFEIDANLVRVLTVIGAFASGGTVALVYIAAWMLMPAR
jgi:phage shock protein C